MKDIYEAELNERIHAFLDRKTRKYPELKLFEQGSRHQADRHPPRVVLHDFN